MSFDFKNILLGMILGFILAVLVVFLFNDVYIDIRIGDDINKGDAVNSY
tara:strand:- start:15892 stop:16038 length:147 start_codon:yes stop_codon:yes gene_type:complete